MRSQIHRTKGRAGRLSAALVLLAGASGTALIFTALPASADGCGSSCSMGGSFDLTPGSLYLEVPSSLSWTSQDQSGFNQQDVDSTDTTFTAVDPTESGDGWTVAATATQFTGTDTANKLAEGTSLSTATLVFNGSTSSETTGQAPSDECASGSTCTTLSDGLTYPIWVKDDGSTSTNIYDSAADGDGEGAFTIGAGSGSHPAGWWLNVPATAVPDTYSSTISLAITTGPPA